MTSKNENLKTTFLVPKTIERESKKTPVRNFLTVSVLVNANADNIKQDDGTIGADVKSKVEAIVKTAVGFKEDTDAISIEFFDFPVPEESDLVESTFTWDRVNQILRNASLAIAAIIALVIGFFHLAKDSTDAHSI